MLAKPIIPEIMLGYLAQAYLHALENIRCTCMGLYVKCANVIYCTLEPQLLTCILGR